MSVGNRGIILRIGASAVTAKLPIDRGFVILGDAKSEGFVARLADALEISIEHAWRMLQWVGLTHPDETHN